MGAGHREAALQEVHDRHSGELWRFGMRLTHDRQLPEDAVQEVLLKACKDPSLRQRDKAAARAWLFTVSRNLIIDKWRSAASRHEQRIEEPPEASVGDVTSVVLDRWLIAEALISLSAAHRSVISTVYYEGRSVADISARLRIPIPEGTVKSRLHYGLRTLRLGTTGGRSDSAVNTIPDKFAQWDAAYVLGALSSAERREFEEYLAALPDGRLGAGRRPGFAGPGITSVPDDELMAELIATPRIGPWTLQGGLLLAPQREDVVLPGDPALRKAVQAACQLDHLRSQQEVLAIAEEWRPYRSLATTYRFSAAFEPVKSLPVARLGSA